MHEGYQVQQAYHMKEALLLDKSHIDVMIIDIQLPDGNGITLCQQMRQQSQIPILFLTAKDDEQTGAGVTVGMNPFNLSNT